MDRRLFLLTAASFLAGTLLGGCRGPRRGRRVRRAMRRAHRRHRRRRRRFRRIVRRHIRRGGRRVHVHVIPVHVQVQDTIVIEEHGTCEVVTLEEERAQVKKEDGSTVWVDIKVEGDAEGEDVE